METLYKVLNEKGSSMRLFAVDCAARVSHLMEDERSRNALRVARAFANGEATEKELKEATKAARAAVAVEAAAASDAAARVATYDAAADADAAYAVAAERKWQKRRLLRYVKGLPCKPVPIQ